MEPGYRPAAGLSRRSFLGAAATAATGTVAARAATAAEYETVSVPPGTRKVVSVDDGATLENALFDVTADGASVSITAYGTDWTIRNVAVRGRVDMGDECVVCAADTGGGTSRIENVWIGDGAVYEEKGGTGVWVHPEHDGHLEVERVAVRNMGDNGFYCSAPGRTGGGTVALRSCYAANCWVSHYRLAEGVVEHCTASVTDTRRYRQGRGVWAWAPGPVEVRGCQLDMNGHHYSFRAGANGDGSHISVTDTQWDDGFHGGWTARDGGSVHFAGGNGTDPRDVVPQGCPKSIADVLPGEVGDVAIEDQESGGDRVTVARAGYTAGGFAVVLTTEAGDVVGRSDPILAGRSVRKLSVDLEQPPNGTGTITARLHHADGENGVGEPVDVDGRTVDDSATVTIEDGTGDEFDVSTYDADGDGRIDFSEVGVAIADYNAGEIGFSDVMEVIAAYNTGREV